MKENDLALQHHRLSKTKQKQKTKNQSWMFFFSQNRHEDIWFGKCISALHLMVYLFTKKEKIERKKKVVMHLIKS